MTVRTNRNGKGRFTKRIDTAIRDLEAAALRTKGYSLQRIADDLGLASRGHAHDAIERAFASLPRDDAKAAKDLDLERLDRLIEKNWEALERQHVAHSQGHVIRRRIGTECDEDGQPRLDPDGKPIPIYEDVLDDGPIAVHTNVINRLIERRAKKYGYDEPVHTRVEIIPADVVEANIARLEAELARNDPAHSG